MECRKKSKFQILCSQCECRKFFGKRKDPLNTVVPRGPGVEGLVFSCVPGNKSGDSYPAWFAVLEVSCSSTFFYCSILEDLCQEYFCNLSKYFLN